jgi:hypothetical protein
MVFFSTSDIPEPAKNGAAQAAPGRPGSTVFPTPWISS